MHFRSFETLRMHKNDLVVEFNRGKIDKKLQHFIVNNHGGKLLFPMDALAWQVAKAWSAIGLLDHHDLVQICYLALLKAWNNVNWKLIEEADDPDAKLWSYLRKRIKFELRKNINNLKDGMRIPEYAQYHDGPVENFFSEPKSQIWFWVNDEVLAMMDESVDRWDHEQLTINTTDALRKALSDTERLVVEFFYGIDCKRKSIKDIAEYFSMKQSWVTTTKSRALKKLVDNQEVGDYLYNLWENL